MNHLYKFTPVVKYIPTRYTYRPTIFGRPFVKRFALCYRTLVCPVLSVLSVYNVGVFWPNGWTDQDETWKAGRPWPRPHCVKWDPAPPPPKRGRVQPHILAHVYCAKRLDASGYHLVRLGDIAPIFSAHVYCGHGRPSRTFF